VSYFFDAGGCIEMISVGVVYRDICRRRLGHVGFATALRGVVIPSLK